MSRQIQTTMGVTLVGMSTRQNTVMQRFFENHCNGDFSIGSADDADIYIIDMDQRIGSDRLAELEQSHSDQPRILISLNYAGLTVDNEEGCILLQKPIQAENLHAALARTRTIIQRHHLTQTKNEVPLATSTVAHSTHYAAETLDGHEIHAFIGSAPDIDTETTQPSPQAFFHPEQFLVGHLQRAIATTTRLQRPHVLETSRGMIWFTPGSDTITTTLRESQIRTLAAFPDIEVTLRPYPDSEVMPAANELFQSHRDMMLWKCTLWAARGRLPFGTNLQLPVYLCHWPNFTRLMLFPYAMQIAAIWLQHPCPLLQTARMLDIPQRYVFAFYSAANTLGLAGISQRESDSLFEEPDIPESRLRSLFIRIVSHLRNEPEGVRERA